MKGKFSLIFLLSCLVICCSCHSAIYFPNALFSRSKPLKVEKNGDNESEGYKMLQRLCKSSYGKPVKEYVTENGLPDYFFAPKSPFAPNLIYIDKEKKKDVNAKFTKSGFAFFIYTSFDKEEKIPIERYNDFTDEERATLKKMQDDRKRQKKQELINTIKSEGDK